MSNDLSLQASLNKIREIHETIVELRQNLTAANEKLAATTEIQRHSREESAAMLNKIKSPPRKPKLTVVK